MAKREYTCQCGHIGMEYVPMCARCDRPIQPQPVFVESIGDLFPKEPVLLTWEDLKALGWYCMALPDGPGYRITGPGAKSHTGIFCDRPEREVAIERAVLIINVLRGMQKEA